MAHTAIVKFIGNNYLDSSVLREYAESSSVGYLDDSLALGGSNAVALMGGYLDDSSDDKREKFAVYGGILGLRGQLNGLELLWHEQTHGLSEPFHAADCECGYGQFKGWEKADRVTLMKELVQIILKLKVWSFACVIPIQDYRAVFPGHASDGPFLLCATTAMIAMAHLSKSINEYIDLWFEEGDHDGKLLEIHKSLKRTPWDGNTHLRGFRTNDKTFQPLQAADLIAREAYKHFLNLGSIPERKPVTRLKKQIMFQLWKRMGLQAIKASGYPDNIQGLGALVIASLSGDDSDPLDLTSLGLIP